MKTNYRYLLLGLGLLLFGCTNQPQQESTTGTAQFNERHRPQFHFTPPSKWMNDPNGMVFYEGEYHLFYQHYPEGNVWGPMHWGHAVSKDLVHWEHLPIALYPDSLGMIFSGSAVVDLQNTSGLGTADNPPMVAIYTYHKMEGEKAGRNDFQTQGIAFSLDKGRSWAKYADNPVMPNPGITDFRDPKVMWHEQSGKWIMALAVYDHIRFYSSPNLKDWQLESSFGEGIGAHGGVWECPDLFKMQVAGSQEEKWVLLVSINPGGPNGGSATQYFVGQFDGNKFVLDEQFRQRVVAESAIPQGVVLTDFEDNAYAGWRATGNAFGSGPAQGAFFKQDRVNNYVGKKLVNSFKTDTAATGSLTSTLFAITSNYINLMVGGMKDANATAVRLIVDGEPVRSATGNNNETLEWVSWDVRDLKGRNARLEILDASTAPKGHILVDHIVLSEEGVDPEKNDGIFIDYGTDNYAGVTWSNVPEEDSRRLFMGWMSNWDYGQVVPTENWRSAMTIARSLSLEPTIDGLRLISKPVDELKSLHKASYTIPAQTASGTVAISENMPFTTPTFELLLDLEANGPDADFVLELSNTKNQKVLIGYDSARKQYYVDRTQAGDHTFAPIFSGVHYAPRLEAGNRYSLRLFADVASIELFADGGKTVMTELVFPDEPFTTIRLLSGKGSVQLRSGSVHDLGSIWAVAN